QSNIPVIMVSGAGGVNPAARSIDIGADDYIRKPFSSGELLARIKAKLRRSAPRPIQPES
ncbi:MAG: response regulator, partial [Chloroflexota bacterium]